MRRTCDVCGVVYEAQRPASRYCSGTCRTRAARAGGVDRPPPELPTDGAVRAAVLAELATVNATETALGQLSLHLAARIDSGAESASSLASCSRELRATLVEAVLQAPSKGESVLDRLRRERAERGA